VLCIFVHKYVLQNLWTKATEDMAHS